MSQAAFQDDRSLEDEKAEWEYDDLHGDEDYDDDGQVVIGVWRRMRDGEVIQEDQVRSNRRRPDQFALEVDKGDSYIDLFPSHVRVPPDEKAILPFTDINREASPLFAHRTTPDISFERFPSGSISPQEWPAPVSISTPSSPLFPARKDSSFSPTLSLPVAIGRSHSTVREPFNSLPEIVLKEARAERAVALDLMQAFLGTQDFDSAAKISSTGKRHEWAGFSDGDDDDDDEVPLRLRGGKGSSSQNSTASANSDSEDRDASSLERDDDTDEDDSSDLSDETSSEISETSDDDEPMIISRAEPSNLKSLFAPSSSVTGGFSLLATLDPNLELSDLDIPLAPEPPDNLPEEMAPLEPLAHSSTSKIIFDSDDSVPMFFRSGDEDEGAQGFWRKEDDKEMREIWERDKLMLTREWKRRHRDAKKQRRRRGGMMADDFE